METGGGSETKRDREGQKDAYREKQKEPDKERMR